MLKHWIMHSNENEESFVPDLKENEEVKKQKIEPKQSFTEPPPRYTEASLVKAFRRKRNYASRSTGKNN